MSLLSRLTFTACACFALGGFARADALTDAVVDRHILPTYETLASQTAAFAEITQNDCSPTSAPLQAAWGQALDAWVAASHLRFGPSEAGNRAFAIAFWPDSRSKTPKALRSLLLDADPVIASAESFATASVAVRGFYALEFLLYDPAYADLASDEYTCDLIRAIARDLAANTAAILSDWQGGFADSLRHPGARPGDRYRTEEEAHQELFKALTTGLEILTDMRLGRPLGTFDHPRPNRAEARRSGRSLRHIQVQLAALRPLALLLAEGDTALTAQVQHAFDKADRHVDSLSGDPTLAGVSDPQKRFQIEALQQDIRDIKTLVGTDIGSKLGVEAGFNALDGD
ncbi:imelysin family protein [Phaeobacter sp. B1627]|uniref:imelysin family protein n=1 Tax=Phaeobacter sp. B1627 TaxID=2583809 RepID=UPI0011196468|nr:imelysin family protein [Phaeobacter sp. B1627]TNJ41849.1 peptidase M75 [Phaeobacter sp. B1627]